LARTPLGLRARHGLHRESVAHFGFRRLFLLCPEVAFPVTLVCPNVTVKTKPLTPTEGVE
jgi:hypothetical protein